MQREAAAADREMTVEVGRAPVATPALHMSVLWASRFRHDARHTWLRGVVTDAVRYLDG